VNVYISIFCTWYNFQNILTCFAQFTVVFSSNFFSLAMNYVTHGPRSKIYILVRDVTPSCANFFICDTRAIISSEPNGPTKSASSADYAEHGWRHTAKTGSVYQLSLITIIIYHLVDSSKVATTQKIFRPLFDNFFCNFTWRSRCYYSTLTSRP